MQIRDGRNMARRLQVVLRYLRRYALPIAIFCGVLGRLIILPDDSRWWLELGGTVAITLVIYLLLHKDGVTRHTTTR